MQFVNTANDWPFRPTVVNVYAAPHQVSLKDKSPRGYLLRSGVNLSAVVQELETFEAEIAQSERAPLLVTHKSCV